MWPEDEGIINLNSGTLYIQKQDGSHEHFLYAAEVNTTTSKSNDSPVYIANVRGLEATFEALAVITKDMFLKMCRVYDAIIQTCPNKKVVHLVLYGKNKKIRKKNFHRAIKILEKEN